MSIIQIKNINQLVASLGHPKSKHPYFTIIDFDAVSVPEKFENRKVSMDFYSISMKDFKGTFDYGRRAFDFEEGSMIFTSPEQVITLGEKGFNQEGHHGWSLFFHLDFIKSAELKQQIKAYNFFNYRQEEALHLSKERLKINACIDNIKIEYDDNIDKFTQEIVVNNIELLLNYCNR